MQVHLRAYRLLSILAAFGQAQRQPMHVLVHVEVCLRANPLLHDGHVNLMVSVKVLGDSASTSATGSVINREQIKATTKN